MSNDNEYARLLREIAAQLAQWAEQSECGGWSTHQVKPQRDLAERIWAFLGRNSTY